MLATQPATQPYIAPVATNNNAQPAAASHNNENACLNCLGCWGTNSDVRRIVLYTLCGIMIIFGIVNLASGYVISIITGVFLLLNGLFGVVAAYKGDPRLLTVFTAICLGLAVLVIVNFAVVVAYLNKIAYAYTYYYGGSLVSAGLVVGFLFSLAFTLGTAWCAWSLRNDGPQNPNCINTGSTPANANANANAQPLQTITTVNNTPAPAVFANNQPQPAYPAYSQNPIVDNTNATAPMAQPFKEAPRDAHAVGQQAA